MSPRTTVVMPACAAKLSSVMEDVPEETRTSMEETFPNVESGSVAALDMERVSEAVPPLRELAATAPAVDKRNVEPAVPEPRRVAADDLLASSVALVE